MKNTLKWTGIFVGIWIICFWTFFGTIKLAQLLDGNSKNIEAPKSISSFESGSSIVERFQDGKYVCFTVRENEENTKVDSISCTIKDTESPEVNVE